MKAKIVIEKYRKTLLRLADRPISEVGEYEVLAEIHASSIKSIDLSGRAGCGCY